MYRTCIYCSADLGSNDALEAFPVGRSLAFDPWKGRLWAVCPKCARWNLSPIEERWEAVEGAERLFTDARLRAQSENVGLAKLADGTRLIRVGHALPGELAAWRYGSQLVHRRRRYLLVAGAAALGTLAVVGGFAAVAGTGALGGVVNAVFQGWNGRRQRKVIHRVPADQSPTGETLVLRRWHAAASVLQAGAGGAIALEVPGYRDESPKATWSGKPKAPDHAVVLPDAHARAFLGRALVHVNESGASRRRLESAVGLLADARTAEAYIRRAAAEGRTLGQRKGLPGAPLGSEAALALEMALHEEQERRALEGELALLEAAWREAEEIAAIADQLATAAALPGPAKE